MKSSRFLIGFGIALLLLAVQLVLRQNSADKTSGRANVSAKERFATASEDRLEPRPQRHRYRQRSETSEDRMVFQPMEAALPLPRLNDEIYTLDNLPDVPGTYWVRQSDGQVSQFLICGLDSASP